MKKKKQSINSTSEIVKNHCKIYETKIGELSHTLFRY